MTIKQAREQVKSRIGDLIRDNLELCGMSVDDLGKAMGIHNSNIYNWVNGKCLPSLPATTAMARIFRTTVELLATGEEA